MLLLYIFFSCCFRCQLKGYLFGGRRGGGGGNVQAIVEYFMIFFFSRVRHVIAYNRKSKTQEIPL